MPRTPYVLRSSLWVPAPLEKVFPFFTDAHNLEDLTPPFLRFRVLTPDPIDIREGALIDYRIGLHGIPMRWRTLISRWEPPHAFVDEQLQGPYTRWHHTHTFEAKDGGTLLGDRVEMIPKGWVLAPLVQKLFVARDVQRIFAYRLQRMTAHFGGDPSTGRVWFE